MEKDFPLATRMFWQTIRWLRKVKQGPSQILLGPGGELLTIVEQWQEHLKDHLNPASTSSIEQAESKDFGEVGSFITIHTLDPVTKTRSFRQEDNS